VTARKVKPLAALEAKARQLMLMVGFGFMAFTGGTILSSMLINRLSHRLASADSRVLDLAVGIFVGQMWILLVLPVLIHLASRFLDLPIWRTAIIAALTGALFNAAIRFVSSGIELTFADALQNGVWLGTLIAGILLSVWGARQGRAWADQRQKIADAAAEARKGQYDQFLAESTALADKRDAARAAEPPVAPAVIDAAPVPAIPPAAAAIEAAPAAPVPAANAEAAPTAPVDPKPPA
jgi:hypothetical protein